MQTEDILMCPGPNEIADRVLRAMMRPATCPIVGEFPEFYEQTLDMLAEVFQTRNEVIARMTERAIAELDPADRHVPSYLIWDERHHRTYGLGATPPGGDYPEHVVSASTLGELGEWGDTTIEQLLAAQIQLRNNRRLQAAMRSSRLPVVKQLGDFDFTFQPSLRREQPHPLPCPPPEYREREQRGQWTLRDA